MKNNKFLFLGLLTILSIGGLAGCNNSTPAGETRAIKAWINSGNEYDGVNKDSIWQKI